MMLPSVSDFPLPVFPKNFSGSVKNFPSFTFSRKISRFFLFHYISPYFVQHYYFPLLLQISSLFLGMEFYILYVYFVSPTLTMMHLCITQCTYWTPLVLRM